MTKPKGSKIIGSVSPLVDITYNPDLPKLEYNEEYTVPWHDFAYEHVWYLDPKFNPIDENIWAVKLSTSDVRGIKNIGYVSPIIERNSALPDVDFDINLEIPYYDFKYDLFKTCEVARSLYSIKLKLCLGMVMQAQC